jgi:hypothetical protein
MIAGAVVLTLLCTTGTLAHARLHRQVDPATGITTYSYFPIPAQRRDKGVALPARQAPRPTASLAPDTRPSQTAVQTKEQTPMPRAQAVRLVPSAYSGFPRVSAETQKKRDSERRRILKQELAWEQAELDRAIENKGARDVVQRHRANIEALNREISNVQ